MIVCFRGTIEVVRKISHGGYNIKILDVNVAAIAKCKRQIVSTSPNLFEWQEVRRNEMKSAGTRTILCRGEYSSETRLALFAISIRVLAARTVICAVICCWYSIPARRPFITSNLASMPSKRAVAPARWLWMARSRASAALTSVRRPNNSAVWCTNAC